MLSGGIVFLAALFGTYAAIALILTYRQIGREEKALEQQTNGDWPRIPSELRGEAADKGTERGDDRLGSADGLVTHTNSDVARHRGGAE